MVISVYHKSGCTFFWLLPKRELALAMIVLVTHDNRIQIGAMFLYPTQVIYLQLSLI